MNATTLKIQKALLAAGFNPNGLDGIWGPATRAAWQGWQARNNLKRTTVPSPGDIAMLLNLHEAPRAFIPWVDEAILLLGLKEGVGKANNPIIMGWDDDLDLHYPGDDVAWCGLFIAHTQRVALPNEPLPANPLGARAYQKFGIKVEPQYGAVGVFWRGSRDGWQGHVGYLVAESATAYCVLGGNQSDSVSYTWIAKDRLLGAYWPVTGPEQFRIRLPAQPTGRLSLNEA